MHPRILLPALFILGLISTSSADSAEATFQIHKGLSFSAETPDLTLDLYRPTEGEQVPCVIVIQGGGFRPQNGQRFKPFAEHLAKNGFAAALISYRGSPEHDYHETMADVQATVRFVRAQSARYDIDPQRIGATGRSAGGTLAALLAVSDLGRKPGDKPIQGAVCFAGVYDFVGRFTSEEQRALQPRVDTKIQTNGAWIAKPFAETSEAWLEASAITHVDAEDPPILFLHSKNDSTVPWPQARDMHDAMTEAGVKAELTIYPDGGHGVKPKDANSMDDMVAFFRKVL